MKNLLKVAGITITLTAIGVAMRAMIKERKIVVSIGKTNDKKRREYANVIKLVAINLPTIIY